MLCSVIAFAQATATPQTLAAPRYDVEIIVFRNIKAPTSREYILPAHSPTQRDEYLDLSSPENLAAAATNGYELIPSTELRLIDVVTNLVKSSRYQLLLHTAWRQPGLKRDQVMPIWIKGGRIYGSDYTSIDDQIGFLESVPQLSSNQQNEEQSFAFEEQTLESLELKLLEQKPKTQEHQGLYELEGKITIALSRYLHIFTDLTLRRPHLAVDSKLHNAAEADYLAAYAANTRILDNHSLKEHRRMRSKNLHYLDNPEFGLLILVTPYETPENVEDYSVQNEPSTSQ